jgi:hypothetical protein
VDIGPLIEAIGNVQLFFTGIPCLQDNQPRLKTVNCGTQIGFFQSADLDWFKAFAIDR